MQGGDQFSFGGALFGWPHADECAAPGEHAPEAWLLLFGTQHATTDILYAALTACKAGRDLFTQQLQTAPKATLTLDFTSVCAAEGGWERLGAARKALNTRGPLPTALVVKCNEDGCPAYGPFSALPHALAGYGQHITSVTLNTAEQDTCPDWQPAAAFVRGIAVVCPNLTTLATDFPFLLPPPDLLTCLTHLTIELPLEGEWDEEEEDHTNEVIASLVAVLPQITHLDIEFWGDRDEGSQPAPWHAIFCQASTTHTLTHLVMHETLTDELVWVLVQHAPALSHLTVLNLLVKADHSGREWGVRELVVTEKRFECEAVHLARLPVSVGVGVGAGAGVGEAMTVRLEGLLFQVVFDQDTADMLQRFATWRCTVGAVTLEVGDTEVSTATLLAVLRQLSDTLQPHGTAPLVDLLGRQWTDNSFLQALAATPTLLPQYKVSLHSDAVLTDESLSALLAMGDRVHSVSVDSLSLQSDQHSNTAWPGWDWLRVSKLDATQLLRLPRPVGVGARGSLSVSSLHLPHDLTQETTEHIRSWLQSATYILHVHLTAATTSDSQAGTLAVQLSLLQALRVRAGAELHMHGLDVTHEVMDALRSLPLWGMSLDLTQCTWPLAPAEYKRLAQCIPVQYRSWRLGNVPQAVLNSACEGVSTQLPQGMGPLRIVWQGGNYSEQEVGAHLIIHSIP